MTSACIDLLHNDMVASFDDLPINLPTLVARMKAQTRFAGLHPSTVWTHTLAVAATIQRYVDERSSHPYFHVYLPGSNRAIDPKDYIVAAFLHDLPEVFLGDLTAVGALWLQENAPGLLAGLKKQHRKLACELWCKLGGDTTQAARFEFLFESRAFKNIHAHSESAEIGGCAELMDGHELMATVKEYLR